MSTYSLLGFMCRIFYFLQIFVCAIRCSTLITTDELCQKCNIHAPTSYVTQYCTDHNSTGHLFLSKSCCINSTSSQSDNIIGIDLRNCSLATVVGDFTGFTDLKVILLQDNTDLKIKAADFKGLNQLEYLSIPKGLLCPGGNESWNITEQTEDAILCRDEINLCNKVSCPNTNSYCVMDGPGSTECVCKQGYHGYKCLSQSSFPTVVFTVVLCSSTIVISGYLWCIQRRKVKKH